MYPQDLRYTKEHEWARVEGEVATIGISSHAQDQLGDIVFVEFPQVGREVKQGLEFGVVESVKSVSNIYSPLSGTVIEINSALISRPEAINKDPYGEGWIIKVKVKIKDKKELDSLLSPEQYKALVEGSK